MAQVEDFLKPESMITPGVAGGLTMTIANTLWVQFGLQQRWSGLLLSFAFGTLVFKAIHISIWQRALYYVLNSLIIFSVAAGGYYLGNKTFGPTRDISPSKPYEDTTFWPTPTTPVYAAEPLFLAQAPSDQAEKPKTLRPFNEIEQLEQERKRLEEERAQLQREQRILEERERARQAREEEEAARREAESSGDKRRPRSFFGGGGF